MPLAAVITNGSSSCSKLFPAVLHHSQVAAAWHGLCSASLTRLLSTGQGFSMSRLITQQDVDTFVQLTGDSNPIHRTAAAAADPAASPNAQHQQPAAEGKALVPGILMASMFPALIGSRFPGALYLSQSLKFRRTAAVGTRVLATVTVSKQSGSRVTFDTVCRDAEGQVLVDGTALALISSSTPPPPAAPPGTQGSQQASGS